MHGAACGLRRAAHNASAASSFRHTGPQAAFLDLPVSPSPCSADVTSSNPSIGGVLTGLGIAPNKLGAVIGVVSIAGWCCVTARKCAKVVGMGCWLGTVRTKLNTGIGMGSWRLPMHAGCFDRLTGMSKGAAPVVWHPLCSDAAAPCARTPVNGHPLLARCLPTAMFCSPALSFGRLRHTPRAWVRAPTPPRSLARCVCCSPRLARAQLAAPCLAYVRRVQLVGAGFATLPCISPTFPLSLLSIIAPWLPLPVAGGRAARDWRRVRHHHGPAAPHRLAGHGCPQVCGPHQRPDAHQPHQAGRAERPAGDQGGLLLDS